MHPIRLEFMQKTPVRHPVECTCYIRGKKPYAAAAIQGLNPFIVQGRQQVRSAKKTPKSKLIAGQGSRAFKEVHKLPINYTFHDL